MANQILFFHGGGSREDFEADKKLVESLEGYLGPSYVVHYPYLPNDGSLDMGRRQQIHQAILESDDGVILVAHSFGASMLLACLSEFDIKRNVAGIFLLATPFWEGSEDWVKPFKLRADFAEKLDKDIPLFFYHCEDDEEVPIAQFHIYEQQLPWAPFREIANGGHQFDNDLNIVADDIRAI